MSGPENGAVLGCGCVERVNGMLAERNTQLVLPIMLWGDQTPRVMIRTDQLKSGRGAKRAVAMFATFCPFCGVKYPSDAALTDRAKGGEG